MTTGLQIALLGGALVGLGIGLLVWRLAPSRPDATDVVRRYSQEAAKERATLQTDLVAGDRYERVGVWAIKRFPAAAWGKTPTKELALLRIPVHRYYGKKVLYGVVGLVIPPVLTLMLAVAGGPALPFTIPAVASLGLGVVLFVSPDIDVRTEAKHARTDFARALSAYIDLVALERLSGAGSRQSMESAAEIGDSWVFRRIGEELQRSSWNGVAPWDALQHLADELGLPELDDLADVMRMSGEGSQVYDNLRARSAAMRAAMLNAERGKANAVSERINMPMSLLGVVFMIILVTPALLNVMGGI